MAARIWVVGSLNVDRTWRVARHPGAGETVMGQAQDPAPGGKGLNQAVAARRMGAAVVLVGGVGDDENGRWLTALVRAEGIDGSRLRVDTDALTGAALIVVDAEGANTVTVDAGANAELVIDDPLGIGAGDVVVAQLEVPTEAVAAAFAEARSAGATTVLNPSPMGAGRVLVPEADLVVVNQAESAALAGTDEPASPDDALAVAEAVAGSTQVVVVTLGAGGLVATGPGGPVVKPGVATNVVDTTGAGDCFAGVLAAGLAASLPLEAALERANRAAAVAVSRHGTVAAMPTAVELVC